MVRQFFKDGSPFFIMPYINKEDQRAWQRKKYRERRIFILDYKLNSGGCVFCGWDEHKEILQFHHKNKKQKKFMIAGHALSNNSLEKIKKEMKKCYLLCPNCHVWEHYKDGNHHGNKNIA